jgi:pimeloyl-ACP methyl ester carboxylesterase
MNPPNVSSATLHVEQWGSDGERVIFIHGGGGSAEFMRDCKRC